MAIGKLNPEELIKNWIHKLMSLKLHSLKNGEYEKLFASCMEIGAILERKTILMNCEYIIDEDWFQKDANGYKKHHYFFGCHNKTVAAHVFGPICKTLVDDIAASILRFPAYIKSISLRQFFYEILTPKASKIYPEMLLTKLFFLYPDVKDIIPISEICKEVIEPVMKKYPLKMLLLLNGSEYSANLVDIMMFVNPCKEKFQFRKSLLNYVKRYVTEARFNKNLGKYIDTNSGSEYFLNVYSNGDYFEGIKLSIYESVLVKISNDGQPGAVRSLSIDSTNDDGNNYPIQTMLNFQAMLDPKWINKTLGYNICSAFQFLTFDSHFKYEYNTLGEYRKTTKPFYAKQF